MQTKITIRNEAQTCYIDIEGTIGMPEERQFGGGEARVATYESFRREVARIAGVAASAVVVNIRSTGGDVNDALLIYEALRSLGARVTTRCYGYTASAATVIAQAADEGRREISSNALYLIHNSECTVEGNAETLVSRAELLRKTDMRLAELYAQRSGRDKESFTALMSENNGSGRWLSPEETVAAGLADRIFDGLLTGVELPEGTPLPPQKGDEAAGSQDDVAGTGSQGEAMPSAKAKRPDGEGACGDAADAAEEAIAAVAVSAVKCAARRFSRCWDNFMERVRERREAKRTGRAAAAKDAGKADEAQDTETPPQGAQAAEKGLPHNAAAVSMVAFEEGQRRYGPSVTSPVEDPSAEPLCSEPNARAYSDDARAFSALR